jgi:hypothetical protein
MQAPETPAGGAQSGLDPNDAPSVSAAPQIASRNSATAASNPSTSRTLLAVFERPPGAVGETVNSAVVIATEPRDTYPQIKTAADYFGPVSEIAAQRGFKASSDPYAFSLGTAHLVREDFSAERGKLMVFQSSLVVIENGQIISFTFIGDSEDDVEDLIANLSFPASSASRHARP